MSFCGLRRRQRVDKHTPPKNEISDWAAARPSAQSANQLRQLPQPSVSLPDVNSMSRPPVPRQVSTFSQATTLHSTPPPVYRSRPQSTDRQRISSNGPPILPAISQQSSFSSFRGSSETLPPSLSVFIPPSAQTQTGFQTQQQQQQYLAQPHTLSPILDSPGPSAALSSRLAARPQSFERIERPPSSRAPTPPRKSSKRGAKRPMSLPVQARQPRTSTSAPTQSRPTSLSPNSIPRKPLPVPAQAPSLPPISSISRFEFLRLNECGIKRSNTGYSSHYGDSPPGSDASDYGNNASDDEDGSWSPPGGLSPNAYEKFAKMTPFERQQSLRYRDSARRSVLPPLSGGCMPPVPEIATRVGGPRPVSQQSQAQCQAGVAQRPDVAATMPSGASFTTQRSEDSGIGLAHSALSIIPSNASVTTQRDHVGSGLQLRPEGMINRRSFASIRTQEGKGVGIQDMVVKMRKRENELELERGLLMPVLSREVLKELRLEVGSRPVSASSLCQVSGKSREAIEQDVRQPDMWDGNQVPDPLNDQS